MMPRGKLLLDETNSRLYRPRPTPPKHARIRWEAAEYRLNWGIQKFNGPHMLVLDPNGHYGVEIETFFTTHTAILDRENYYIKEAAVRAMCLTEPTQVVTIVKGKQEMLAEVPAGAFVVQNVPLGAEQYAMSAEEFLRRYMPRE